MKYFSLLGSVSKERIIKQRIGKWQDCKFILYRSEKKSANERCQGLSKFRFGQEVCSICQLLGSKLKPVATLLINKQNDSPKFFSLNNLLVEVCPPLQIEDLEFRLYWKSSTLKIVWISQNAPSKSCAIILDEDCWQVLYVMQPYICVSIMHINANGTVCNEVRRNSYLYARE